MPNLGETVSQWRAHLFGRAVVPLKIRKARLDGRIAALERVILGIGDLGRVFGVIGPVRLGDLQRQTVKLLARLGRRQLIDGLHIGHPRLSLVLPKV